MPKRGLHFTIDTSERYLRGCGLSESELEDCLTLLKLKAVHGAQGRLPVFNAIDVQSMALKYGKALIPLAPYLTPSQKSRHRA